MKYCSHQHKNPDDAMFCHECGERLPEAIKSNKCPKCNQVNPKDAQFCFNCGSSLVGKPESQEYYTLKVRSKKVCDKIYVKGLKYLSNIISDISECEFKIPKTDPIVDVIYESDGITYKYNVDCRISNDVNISRGDIIFNSNCICEVKISGSNMSTPLVLKNAQKRILSVPAGKTYEVEAQYDGWSKRSTVVATPVRSSEVKLNFITDNSDTTIDDSNEECVELTPTYGTSTIKSSNGSNTSSSKDEDPPAYLPLLVGAICLLIGYALWPSKFTFYLMGFGGLSLLYGIILSIGEVINFIKRL